MLDALYKSIKIPTEYYVVALILALIVGCVSLYKKRSIVQSVEWALLVGYVFLVFSSTVMTRAVESDYDYDFRLFWSYIAISEGKESLLSLNIANVLMLMPVGFLLSCIGITGYRQVALIGGLISGIIEFLQLILKRGMFEFDDIFHNILGCVVGCLIYRVYKRVRKIIKIHD